MTACGPSSTTSCGPRARFDFAGCSTLAEMVDHFLAVRDDQTVREQNWWGAEGQTLEQACERAMFMLGRKRGRDRHQRPFSAADLTALGERLATGARSLEAAPDFESLRIAVEQALGYPPGGAPLLVYDVAQRLGCYLNKAPDQVYLHAGPKVGAENLKPGLGGSRRRPLIDFPTSVRTRLTPAEAEDFLCVARNALHPGLWD
jgi:hypothetical protein